jgi:hypothetical protein
MTVLSSLLKWVCIATYLLVKAMFILLALPVVAVFMLVMTIAAAVSVGVHHDRT